MPCEECEEGKYKWGEMGECLYETLEDCQLANQEEFLEEALKPISDKPIDWTYNFTKEQMDKLHEDGELIVEVEKEEEESMTLLFTYKKEEVEEELEELEEEKEEVEEEEYAGLTASMLDDELDAYIDKIVDSIKELHK
jgi:hypothetical protein